MAELPIIPASVPTEIAAVEAKIYDRYVMLSLRVDASNPNAPVVVIAELKKVLVHKDGSTELSPEDESVFLRIDDAYALAAVDSDFAQVIGGILMFVVKYGTELGVL